MLGKHLRVDAGIRAGANLALLNLAKKNVCICVQVDRGSTSAHLAPTKANVRKFACRRSIQLSIANPPKLDLFDLILAEPISY